MAVAGRPQPTVPGMNMVAIAGSVYRGQPEQAFILRLYENGWWIYKGSVTTNTRGVVRGVVSGGYQR
ncbi:hypothetical protein CFB82_39990 [Burkholderia sp. HI2714]|nr:hypothetical protein CFB82_39990 [Burkholderia sp. HI2714]